MVENVDVGAERPYFLPGYETEGFGGKRLGAAEGGFEDAGEVGFQVGLSGGGWGDLAEILEALSKRVGKKMKGDFLPISERGRSLPSDFEGRGCEG